MKITCIIDGIETHQEKVIHAPMINHYLNLTQRVVFSKIDSNISGSQKQCQIAINESLRRSRTVQCKPETLLDSQHFYVKGMRNRWVHRTEAWRVRFPQDMQRISMTSTVHMFWLRMLGNELKVMVYSKLKKGEDILPISYDQFLHELYKALIQVRKQIRKALKRKEMNIEQLEINWMGAEKGAARSEFNTMKSLEVIKN